MRNFEHKFDRYIEVFTGIRSVGVLLYLHLGETEVIYDDSRTDMLIGHG